MRELRVGVVLWGAWGVLLTMAFAACAGTAEGPGLLRDGVGGSDAGRADSGGRPLVDCGGAQVDPSTDVHNCGGCGTVCKTGLHGTASCVAGKCSLHCATGWASCSVAGGCDTQVASAATDCGTCGHSCGAQVCLSGQCCPPLLGLPSSFSCNPFTQCGCRSGEKCVVTSATETACSANGTLGAGAACAADVDCARPLSCVRNQCASYCDPAAGCTASGNSLRPYCAPVPAAASLSSIGYCQVPCDVTGQMSAVGTLTQYGAAPCPPEHPNCQAVAANAGSAWYASCTDVGASGLGESCSSATCAAGFECVTRDGGATAFCQPYCYPSFASVLGTSCPPSTTCGGFSTSLTIDSTVGPVEIGACL